MRTGVVTQNITVQEKIGEVQHTDSSGRNIGTSTVYANRNVTVQHEVWHGYQGNRQLDDHDFFRIGNDIETADKIMKSRETGVTLNRIGLGILAAGAAAIIAGYAARPSDPSSSAGLSNSLMIGGGLLVPVGGIMAYYGIAKAKQEHPVDDRDRAADVAARYNAQLGAH